MTAPTIERTTEDVFAIDTTRNVFTLNVAVHTDVAPGSVISACTTNDGCAPSCASSCASHH